MLLMLFFADIFLSVTSRYKAVNMPMQVTRVNS